MPGAPRDPSSSAARPTVLVVDDEADIRASVAALITSAFTDVRVLEAADGAAALALAETMPIDLLVTDLRMPGMDGLELVQRMRGVRAVLMTAFGPAAVRDAARDPGILDLLAKPLDVERLLGHVGRVAAPVGAD